MATFDDLLSRGFALLLDSTNAPTVATKTGSAKCVSTPIAHSKELRTTGFWPEFNGVVEITRADFLKLRVKDRTVVTYAAPPPGNWKLILRVIGIEDDSADPCVKLTLKAESGGKEE